MYLFPLTAQLATPHVMTLHSHFPFDCVQTWTGDADDFYMQWASSVPMVDISEHASAERMLPLNIVGVVHHGLPISHFRPATKQPGEFFVWLGRFVPEKGSHLAIEAAQKAGKDAPVLISSPSRSLLSLPLTHLNLARDGSALVP